VPLCLCGDIPPILREKSSESGIKRLCENGEMSTGKIHGRGAASNPQNRFEKMSYQISEWDEPDDPSPQTVFLRDETRSIINYNDSPDVGFAASIDPYRGCEHGCI